MSLALRLANLALLILYPVAWTAPLARAGILPFFTGDELTILGGIGDLLETDIFLAGIVALFAVLTPYFKTMVLTVIHFGWVAGDRWIRLLELSGKLSMADIFLLALYIVLIKGVGVGHVEVAWGLYLFTACVLTSLAIALLTKRGAA